MSDPLATHSFLSHLRTGLGAQVTSPASAAPVRRAADLAVVVNDDPNRSASVSVELSGPVDAAGFDANLVVRTDPAPGAFDVEPNYFAAIEFDPPDLPWRFSPLERQDGRVLPWLALILLATDEFARRPAAAGRPAAIAVNEPGRTLPAAQQRWAWAHVQVGRRVTEPDAGAAALAAQVSDPARVVSRLLAPRRLRPTTQYVAFVVPAFEAGRLAGLGKDPGADGAAAAWAPDSPAGHELPVYFEWTFRTGRGGDFESLVRRLQPRKLDDRVGTRPLAVGPQPYSVPALADAVPLDSALRHVTAAPPPMPDLATFAQRLTEVLDAPADLADGRPDAPRALAPPLYGMWHAQQFRVGPPGSPQPWLRELNTDPRRRAQAGLGAEVIRTLQEPLMAEAWRQVGDVERANEALRRAQLGRSASRRLWARQIAAAPAATVAAETRLLQARVRSSAGGTVAAAVTAARLPDAAVTPAMRRVSAPRGVISRRLGLPAAPAFVSLLNEGALAAAGPPPERPAGMLHLDDQPPSGPIGPVGPHGPVVPAGPVLDPTAGGTHPGGGEPGPGLTGPASPSLPGPGAPGPGPAVGPSGPVIGPVGPAGPVGPVGPGGPAGPVGRFDPSGPVIGPADPDGTAGEGEAATRAFGQAAGVVLQRAGLRPAPARVAPSANLVGLRDDLVSALDPATTVARRVLATIHELRPLRPATAPAPTDPIEPVMAAPSFPQPMYAPLRDLTPEHLLAGLEHVPLDTLALVRTNRRYVESYLAGLNHEMSRELLWRGYPTDQRGTYFRQFFDAPQRDITAMHEWQPPSELGDHEANPAGVDEPLVLLIRGELLRRYPTAAIYAVKAQWDPVEQRRELAEATVKLPLFRGTLPTDVTFVGFDLEPEMVRGSLDPAEDQGWFFVIAEQPSEPRFGFDDAEGPAAAAPAGFSDLSWGHFAADAAAWDGLSVLDLDVDPPHWPWPFDGTGTPPVHWRSRAAEMAVATLQRPVRVAVHASRMLP